MRHVEDAADRIGQRMHGRHRCIRKCRAGEPGAEQHRLPRFQVRALPAGAQQVGRQKR